MVCASFALDIQHSVRCKEDGALCGRQPNVRRSVHRMLIIIEEKQTLLAYVNALQSTYGLRFNIRRINIRLIEASTKARSRGLMLNEYPVPISDVNLRGFTIHKLSSISMSFQT